MKYFVFDLKRIFARRTMAALCMAAPLIVLLLFAVVFVPMFTTGEGGIHFRVAVCNEDTSDEVAAFLSLFLNSKGPESLMQCYPVKTPAEGMKLLEGGDVAMFVHVPEGMFRRAAENSFSRVTFTGAPRHGLELYITSMLLRGNMALAFNMLSAPEVISRFLLKTCPEADPGEISVYLAEEMNVNLKKYMSRYSVFGETAKLSLVGEILPLPFYGGAVFSLFAALATLPMVRFTAVDVSGPVLRRGLLCGKSRLAFWLARVGSGAVFIALVISMLVPAGLLLLAVENVRNMIDSDLPALLVSVAAIALCYSTLAFALGVWAGGPRRAVWLSFYLVLAMGVFSGIFVSETLLPEWAAAVGRFMPMRSAMRLISGSLVPADWPLLRPDIFKLLAAAAAFAAAGLAGLCKKGG